MNSEETQNQAGQTAYLERAKALGINPANQVQVSATSGKIGTPKTASVMDASLLGTPALKVPETTPVSTVASGIGGMASSIAESSAKAVTDSISADKVAKEAELKDSKSLIKSLQEKALNITGSRQAEEEKAQIAQKAQATSDARAEAQIASNNIIASQRAQQNEIAQLEKNLGGMSASALQGETQRINRQYAKEQADLSLISLVANTKLNNANFDLATAQSIVDKKIENQLEPLKMEMDFAREFYQENRDAFSKAEDREFQNNALMAERAYNTEKANLEKISALQLEAAKNGAPSSVIRAIGNAGNFSEAVAASGGYASDQLDRQIKQAQLAKLQLENEQNLPGVVSAKAQQESLTQLSLVDSLLTDKKYENVVGVNRLNPFSYLPGTDVQYAKNQFNQLKASLSLENRQKLKGSGAISDFEAKILGQAASALGTNLSNEAAEIELKKIRGAFANAAGLPSLVKITDPSTGQSVTVNATREVVNQALIDGGLVEYK